MSASLNYVISQGTHVEVSIEYRKTYYDPFSQLTSNQQPLAQMKLKCGLLRTGSVVDSGREVPSLSAPTIMRCLVNKNNLIALRRLRVVLGNYDKSDS